MCIKLFTKNMFQNIQKIHANLCKSLKTFYVSVIKRTNIKLIKFIQTNILLNSSYLIILFLKEKQ